MVQTTNQGKSVASSIKKVGIAKRNVLGTHSDLLGDVLQNDFLLYDAKLTVVDRDNWAVSAPVLASATCFCVTHGPMRSVRHVKVRILVQYWQSGAIGREKLLSCKRD